MIKLMNVTNPCTTVLDVGAGLGLSKGRIPGCVTQDPGPGTEVDLHTPINDMPPRSYEVVTAFDVIEHVVEDVDFLHHLCRIACRAVFITTPNLNVSYAANGCHCREYSPAEFLRLLSLTQVGDDRLVLLCGNGPGTFSREVSAAEFLLHKEPHQAALIHIYPWTPSLVSGYTRPQ